MKEPPIEAARLLISIRNTKKGEQPIRDPLAVANFVDTEKRQSMIELQRSMEDTKTRTVSVLMNKFHCDVEEIQSVFEAYEAKLLEDTETVLDHAVLYDQHKGRVEVAT